MGVRRLAVASYPWSFRTQAIRTQTQMVRMIRTQATGCFVAISFGVEIRFHQPKQRFTCICGGTLNPGARFSKVPRTFRIRKAIRKTPTRLFCKAGPFICLKGISF